MRPLTGDRSGLGTFLDEQDRITNVTVVFREIDEEGFTPFAGTTTRGIGASSTIADVEAAYGRAPEKRGNLGDCLVYPGCMFVFHDGALHEITLNRDIEPRERKPLPPPHGPNATSRRALELVAELEQRLAAYPKLTPGFTPTTPEILDNFEHRIGHRLPPSYRELVLTKGTLHVETDWGATFMMIPVADLGGPEPTSWIDEGDDDVDGRVARAVYFAYEHDDAVENFFAFDPEATGEDGEMPVSRYFHDERFELDGAGSFADYLEGAIEELFESYATDDADD